MSETTTVFARSRLTVPTARGQRLLTSKHYTTDAVSERSDGELWEPSPDAWKAIRILARELRLDADMQRVTLVWMRHD